jgi:hypothetical protein
LHPPSSISYLFDKVPFILKSLLIESLNHTQPLIRAFHYSLSLSLSLSLFYPFCLMYLPTKMLITRIGLDTNMEKKKRHEWVNGHLFTLFSHINYLIVTLTPTKPKEWGDIYIYNIVIKKYTQNNVVIFLEVIYSFMRGAGTWLTTKAGK